MVLRLSDTAIGDRTWSEISGQRPARKLVSVCDMRSERLASVTTQYPAVEVTGDYDEVLKDPRVDVIAIATPVSSHYELALQALKAGKHVFIEKPMTATTEQALRLLDEADRRGLVIGVDHTFVYTGAVRKMRELVTNESLGRHLLLRLRTGEPRDSFSTTST